MKTYNTDDVIYALATPYSRGAIAVIRVSGEGCVGRLSTFFRCGKPLIERKSGSAVFGTLLTVPMPAPGESETGTFSPKQNGTVIDNCVVTVYRNGHGYTGEEAAELSVHGGLETIGSVLRFLGTIGFRQAERGEFTLRSFLHGKMDLTQAEAVNELINSRGEKARSAALSRLNGALVERIGEIKTRLLDVAGVLEVQLDYSEEEIGESIDFPEAEIHAVVDSIRKIADTYSTGRLYNEGAKIVLAGAPNAGKSSLFNLFLKEDRSIVSSLKGTTRDYIESDCSVGGFPVRLFDTAGLRESENEIEEEGVRRSYSLLDGADLILFLVDAADPVLDEGILEDERCIPVLNKVDLIHSIGDSGPGSEQASLVEVGGLLDLNCFESSQDAGASLGGSSFEKNIRNFLQRGFFAISAETGEGFTALCKEIESRLGKTSTEMTEETIVIESGRQRDCLSRACGSLEAALEHYAMSLPVDIISIDVQEALLALGELTGEVAPDDILDNIFGSFCVGK